MTELIDFNDLIPTGLNELYPNVNNFIDHLNALHPNLIRTLVNFISSLLHKYNVGGSILINWDCPLKGTVICCKKNMNTLIVELYKLNNKGKIMFLIAVNYFNQINKRKCCPIILNNVRFKIYWGSTITINDDLANGTNNPQLTSSTRNIEIVPSGSGMGQSGGANSIHLDNPIPKAHYYLFNGNNQILANPHGEPNTTGVKGRHHVIHRVQDMNLPSLTDPFTGNTFKIKDYTHLYQICFSFLAGNNTNGLDRPDVHTWLPVFQRRAEKLELIFHDEFDEDIYTYVIWDPVCNRLPDGSLPPIGTVIPCEYNGSLFTKVCLTRSHFGHILHKAKGFRFNQWRNTGCT